VRPGPFVPENPTTIQRASPTIDFSPAGGEMIDEAGGVRIINHIRGDGSLLMGRDRYCEFEEFMKQQFIASVSAPQDPGSIRFRKGDWLYVKSLWLNTRDKMSADDEN
jgi:hypothetical protein